MANYNVVAKVVVGSRDDLGSKVATAINSVDNTKVIRGITIAHLSADNFLALIVHDA